jgi:L-fucose isomerase-like protein
MEQAPIQDRKQDCILTLKGVEPITAKELDTNVTMKKITNINHESNSSDREIRKNAEKKAFSTVKIQRMLKELMGTGISFAEIIKSDATLGKLNSIGEGGDIPEDVLQKVNILKTHAPKVYERLLQIERSMQLMEENGNNHPDLYKSTEAERDMAQRQWDFVQKMANQTATA